MMDVAIAAEVPKVQVAIPFAGEEVEVVRADPVTREQATQIHGTKPVQDLALEVAAPIPTCFYARVS
jgi:hypothetical protein